MGLLSIIILFGTTYWLFNKLTLQVREQSESVLLSFGKLEKKFTKSGLHWVPQKIFPWVNTISVSKQIDHRTYKSIQVNDRFGTTVVVDLWIEFRISEPYRALFSVENWEEVLQSVVVHSTASILCSQTVNEILKHRTELSEQLKASIALETERWGISLLGAMIQNIGLLPEISKQFFQSVAARIERTTAFIQEEGRLNVARLDASTAHRIAEMNGLARSQLPIEISNFYQSLAADPMLLKKFQEYWELINLDPRKTVTFSGFSEHPLAVVEATKAIESVLSH
jgi:regulator of protease activity HflC (stomatin/prohibitin superfamily)